MSAGESQKEVLPLVAWLHCVLCWTPFPATCHLFVCYWVKSWLDPEPAENAQGGGILGGTGSRKLSRGPGLTQPPD